MSRPVCAYRSNLFPRLSPQGYVNVCGWAAHLFFSPKSYDNNQISHVDSTKNSGLIDVDNDNKHIFVLSSTIKKTGIGNYWVEIIIEDDIHGFDFHRAAIAFENIIDTFGRMVFPSIYLTLIAGLVKTVGV